ncbi:MAG: MerR family transcriptional regulator [Propionibacteriaceae bacterium]|nr:MerR family transcriptional regulator [Propionibacteriaceae bacterium]
MSAEKPLKIKEVVDILKEEQPDLSITTVRFWEDQGLIKPMRTKSGYRLFTHDDIERLRYIIVAQRDHYLPLKVIKENLDLLDQGLDPRRPDAPATSMAASNVDEDEETSPEHRTHTPAPARRSGGAGAASRASMKLTRQELLAQSGLPESSLVELERQKIIQPRRGTSYYGWEAFTLAFIARKMVPLGVDTRQLNVIKQAAEHEVAIIRHTVAGYRKRESQQKATFDLAELVVQAHAALIQVVLDHSEPPSPR